MIGVNINPVIFERGSGGVPSTTMLYQLGGRLDRYEHATSARGGFESLRLEFVAERAEAIDWLANGPMRSVIVYGPDGEVVWEGYLHQVEATFGQEKRTVSLDKLATRCRVKFTDSTGASVTSATNSDTTAVVRYGTKDAILNLPTSGWPTAAATNWRDVELARRKAPPMAIGSEIATSSGGGSIRVALLFRGWYSTLDWILRQQTDDVVFTPTYTDSSLWLEQAIMNCNAINNFLSTDWSSISATGNNSYNSGAPSDMSYQQIVDYTLNLGTGTDRLAWGIYENRQARLAVWAGATPTTITYQRALGSGDVFDASGARIAPWNVRPDANVQVVDLLDITPVAGPPDAAARYYAERVTCRIDSGGVGVTLEPQASDSIDAQLAALSP